MLISLAQQVEGAKKPPMVTVRWKDGLPQDVQETIDAETRKLEASVQSRLGAIETIYDIDEAAAKDKLKEIDEEEDAARNSEGLNNAVNNPPEQPQNRRIEVTLGG
jgi:hypothetical protein